MDVATILPDDLKRALFNLVTKEPAQIAKERLEMLKLYRDRAAVLQKQEEELHDSLPVHIQRVVKGKRLLLFEERLQTNAFPDMQVMNDFKQGVDLVGEEPYSPLFLEKLQPATMTVRQLDLSAAWNRKLVIGRPLADHEKEHADRLVELSQEEETTTKRERSHVNAAFASRSYLDLQDVDVLAALLVMLTQIFRDGPNVEVHLSDGTSLKGRLSAAARSKDALVGRCFDLSKAYKQLAVSKDSLRYSVLGARDNSGQWFFYVGQSLPFGSTSSVYSFNKAARALQFLLWRDFQIVRFGAAFGVVPVWVPGRFRKVPGGSGAVPVEVPEGSGRFGQVPEGSGRFGQVVVRVSDWFRKVPGDSGAVPVVVLKVPGGCGVGSGLVPEGSGRLWCKFWAGSRRLREVAVQVPGGCGAVAVMVPERSGRLWCRFRAGSGRFREVVATRVPSVDQGDRAVARVEIFLDFQTN
eukprot:s2607_g10.t1